MKEQTKSIRLSDEVALALEKGTPVVALESAVITHGLPYPENMRVAMNLESIIRQSNATPATIALLDGVVHIGITQDQLERLARESGMHKISRRDFGAALALGWSGGTTVAGTMLGAKAAGIRIFATGGIGGVHYRPSFDVSADLPALASIPMVVVCAGAKAILDLDATLEYLETVSVPVIGYQTDEFPAFYARRSGLKVSASADTPEQIAAIAQAHWAAGNDSAVLVVNPPPEASALEYEVVQKAVQQALEDAEAQGVRGQAVTPFLLSRMTELTGGASLEANLELLRNNARLAAEISPHLVGK
jgi:pseudouridine-5'-phosphate glycosidase